MFFLGEEHYLVNLNTKNTARAIFPMFTLQDFLEKELSVIFRYVNLTHIRILGSVKKTSYIRYSFKRRVILYSHLNKIKSSLIFKITLNQFYFVGFL